MDFAQALQLSSCTLRLCRVNKHGFCTTFPGAIALFLFHDRPSQTRFQNDETVPYLILSELFAWSYAFVLQDCLLKLNYLRKCHNIGVVWLNQQSVTCAIKSGNKIAGVTSVLRIATTMPQRFCQPRDWEMCTLICYYRCCIILITSITESHQQLGCRLPYLGQNLVSNFPRCCGCWITSSCGDVICDVTKRHSHDAVSRTCRSIDVPTTTRRVYTTATRGACPARIDQLGAVAPAIYDCPEQVPFVSARSLIGCWTVSNRRRCTVDWQEDVANTARALRCVLYHWSATDLTSSSSSSSSSSS